MVWHGRLRKGLLFYFVDRFTDHGLMHGYDSSITLWRAGDHLGTTLPARFFFWILAFASPRTLCCFCRAWALAEDSNLYDISTFLYLDIISHPRPRARGTEKSSKRS